MKIKFNKSIGFKILFFYMMLAFINISFVIFIIFENQVDLISKNSKLEIEQQFSNLISVVKRYSSEAQQGTLFKNGSQNGNDSQFLKMIEPYISRYFLITDKGEILKRSDPDLEPPPSMAKDAIRSITSKNFSGKEYYLRINDKSRTIYCYIPFSDTQSGNIILLAVKDMGLLNESLKNLYKQAIFVIIVVLFFHTVFALTLFKYIINPIKQLTRSAKKISEGELETRIPLYGGGDELESLAESFNIMAASVNKNIKKLAGEIESSQKTIKKSDNLSIKDTLTSLYNKAYIQERINEEINKTSKADADVAIIMIDIDNFKTVNTIYGQRSGDIIIFELSKIITRHCSENDIPSRYIDDSFIILSTHCNNDNVKNLAENIRSEIEDNTIVTPDGNFSVTVSIGVSFVTSGLIKDSENGLGLIKNAEVALMKAKKSGKNRVEFIS